MESSKALSTDKATVIIQINPQVAQDTPLICDDGQQTVQVMIGVTLFLFGIVRTNSLYSFSYPPISVMSGITYWGSLIYIVAGSLSIAAQNKLHLCVVKASLVMNLISAVTAAIAIILIGIEIQLISEPYRKCSYSYDHTDSNICSNFKKYDLGITGVLLLFSILQFIISIFISRFACKATHSTHSTVLAVTLN